jgi:hypothetical protein
MSNTPMLIILSLPYPILYRISETSTKHKELLYETIKLTPTA